MLDTTIIRHLSIVRARSETMGGRGASTRTGGVKQVTVNMNGTHVTYRKEKDGNVYRVGDSTMVPRTLKQITESAKKMGYEYQTYDASQVRRMEKKRLKDRKETDKILDGAYVSDKHFVKGSRMSRIGNRATRKAR